MEMAVLELSAAALLRKSRLYDEMASGTRAPCADQDDGDGACMVDFHRKRYEAFRKQEEAQRRRPPERVRAAAPVLSRGGEDEEVGGSCTLVVRPPVQLRV